MKFILIISLFVITNLYSTDMFKGVSLYPFGIVEHLEPVEETYEGSMKYFAISKTFDYEDWCFEAGGGTFIDSYEVKSYRIFTNISHKDYRWGIFTPMLAIDFYSKGEEYSSDKRKQIIAPGFKLRIGDEDGLFMNIQPVPKISDLTNGFIAVEFGYKF